MAMGATIAGEIMGTAAYMAPEQARGKPVDKRADIWAFGVVLYEMLTGRRLFDGEAISDTLAGVLTKEPEWSHIPARAQPLLKGCLEKDPKRRLRDIGDAWRLLDETPLAPAARRRVPWMVAAMLTFTSAIALWAPWRSGVRLNERASMRLDLDLGPDVSLGSGIGPSVILSPDGTRVVFVSEAPDGIRRLFTRALDEHKATRLAGTEGAQAPFFKPDGQWVGFFATAKLKKTRIDGGEPVILCNAPAGRGGSWGDDGNIYAALDSQVGLSQVPSEGGRPVPLTELGPDETSHRWPQVLPGGKGVLFTFNTEYGAWEGAKVAVVSPNDRHKKVLLDYPGGLYPRYLSSGHLVYVNNGTMFAVPFDLNRLEVQGSAVRLEDVANNTIFGFAQFDVSPNGAMLYRTGRTSGLSTVQWVNDTGKTEALGIEAATYSFPRLSPDGSRLAVVVRQGASADILIRDLNRGSTTSLTRGLHLTSYLVWSPESRFLVFQSVGGMFWTPTDGAAEPRTLMVSKSLQFPTSFSPDGRRLAFSQLIPGEAAEIRIASITNESGSLAFGKAELFLKTRAVNAYPTFSPDGHWLAYADTDSGNYEVYVRAFPDRDIKVPISNAGGAMPIWSPNGRELFYRSEDQRIMIVDYSVKDGTFVAEKPRVWSEKRLNNTGLATNFDIAPDGKRFIGLLPDDSPEPQETKSHFKIATDIFDEIRRRAAAPVK
jgi:serine/threonine-protein kinase